MQMKKTNRWTRKKARREYFVLPNRQGNLPFSDAVRVGNTFYLSGHIGLDPKTSRPKIPNRKFDYCLRE